VTYLPLLTQVNDTSLENVTHDEAVAALKSTGEHVRLLIAKTSRKVTDDTSSASAHDTSYASAGKYCLYLTLPSGQTAVSCSALRPYHFGPMCVGGRFLQAKCRSLWLTKSSSSALCSEQAMQPLAKAYCHKVLYLLLSSTFNVCTNMKLTMVRVS